MVREISAGGVVVRKQDDEWQIAVIEPQREPEAPSKTGRAKSSKITLALPKGIVDPGEKPAETALREVFEETGLKATPVAKLADIKYVYIRSWGDQQKVFKIVSFYLFRYASGKIGEIADDMKVEVRQALWIPLADANKRLAYRGERDVVKKAQEYLKANPQE
ncbi:MAG TPA: NUDIX domain-containing protein [Terriglobales bacterium]|jgi:8-oxo-dGTP pyrophosphatase MutT (NUDIX family)|nr:NUDIX domain-containing protein [Terriglobales bacterium]